MRWMNRRCARAAARLIAGAVCPSAARLIAGAVCTAAALLPAGADGRVHAQTRIDLLHPQPRAAYVRMEYSAVFMPRPGQHIWIDPLATGTDAAAAAEAAASLNAALRTQGLDTLAIAMWTPADTSAPGIFLGTGGEFLNALLARLPDQRIQVNAMYPGSEGYVLDGMAMRVLVVASDAQGLRFGSNSLIQLLSSTAWGLQPFRVVDAPEYAIRWMYQATNIQVAKNVDNAKALWTRAADLRLNGIHLNDSKFSRPTTLPRFYLDSLTSLVRYAAALGLDLVPGVMPFGYSNSMLFHDPNYAAGLPVRMQQFVIEGDTARLVPHRSVQPMNGDFEQHTGNTFPGFTSIDKPGAMSFADAAIRHGGATSIRFENFAAADPQNGNGRIMKWMRVEPFTQYHVGAWVRTEDLAPANVANIAVLAPGGRSLAFNEFAVPSTTPWTKLDFTFNTLDADSIGIYWGVWGARAGRIWWDDLVVEEASFVNLVRRPGAPLVVRGMGRSADFTEGTDFEPLRDPLMGTVPYLGEYTRWHTPPALRAHPGGALRNGDSVMVSYFHTIVIHSDQVAMAMSEPSLMSIVEREFRMLDSLIHPRTWFMQHDEIRVMNWDAADAARSLTPGTMLAENVRACMDIIHRANPSARIWVWSDMFDEYHNAVAKNYYLVNGNLRGSADLLPKDLGIVNWNGQASKCIPSMEFFASRGLHQVTAPFYDTDAAQIRTWRERMRGIADLEGMMYTTWRSDYRALDAFAEYAWNHAPYIIHEPPPALPASGGTLAMTLTINGDGYDAGWMPAGASIFYRFGPQMQFTSVPVSVTPGIPVDVPIVIPAGTTWIQWYVTATDNRGFTTRVPLGDSVHYELGAIATGAEDVPRGGFDLHGAYPNPASAGGIAHADLTAPAGAAVSFEVADVLGRTLRSWTHRARGGMEAVRIDLGGLPGGMYFVRVCHRDQVRFLRLGKSVSGGVRY